MANQSIKNGFTRFWQHVNIALGNKADKSEIPTKTSQLTNDSNYATTTYVNETLGEIESVLAAL